MSMQIRAETVSIDGLPPEILTPVRIVQEPRTRWSPQ
jgi:hypothetical protein